MLFAARSVVEAKDLAAATSEFSKATVDRARRELTRLGVLSRSRDGMQGPILYSIDRRKLLLLRTSVALFGIPESEALREQVNNNGEGVEPSDHADDLVEHAERRIGLAEECSVEGGG